MRMPSSPCWSRCKTLISLESRWVCNVWIISQGCGQGTPPSFFFFSFSFPATAKTSCLFSFSPHFPVALIKPMIPLLAFIRRRGSFVPLSLDASNRSFPLFLFLFKRCPDLFVPFSLSSPPLLDSLNAYFFHFSLHRETRRKHWSFPRRVAEVLLFLSLPKFEQADRGSSLLFSPPLAKQRDISPSPIRESLSPPYGHLVTSLPPFPFMASIQ